mgnify:FL=1
MQIELNKEQYRNLIIMSSIANTVFGNLGDALPDDYKKESLEMQGLESYLLEYAEDFKCAELAQDNEGEVSLSDEVYEEYVMPIMEDYDEHQLFDGLANKLAWRDFRSTHTEEEKKEMASKNGNYFGVEIYDYEDRYWKEFDEHGFERLVVKE